MLFFFVFCLLVIKQKQKQKTKTKQYGLWRHMPFFCSGHDVLLSGTTDTKARRWHMKNNELKTVRTKNRQ